MPTLLFKLFSTNHSVYSLLICCFDLSHNNWWVEHLPTECKMFIYNFSIYLVSNKLVFRSHFLHWCNLDKIYLPSVHRWQGVHKFYFGERRWTRCSCQLLCTSRGIQTKIQQSQVFKCCNPYCNGSLVYLFPFTHISVYFKWCEGIINKQSCTC